LKFQHEFSKAHVDKFRRTRHSHAAHGRLKPRGNRLLGNARLLEYAEVMLMEFVSCFY
jgi:hypothetical protein